MEERECDGDRAEKSSGESAVCFVEVCHQRGGKMCIDIFTFQENPLACVRAHQGVVTFCFHNLHRNRVGMRYDEL